MADRVSVTLAGYKLVPIGFGCGPLGVHGFGQVDLDEVRRAILMALDEGIALFDTSDAYGRGLSEEQLAKALGKRRGEAVIATKAGIRFDAGGNVFYDNSPDYLQTALENSLRRLKTDHIELYQLHYWDRKTPLEDIFAWFEQMVEQGRITAYGVSNLDLSRHNTSFFSDFPNLASHSDEFSLVRQQNRDLILRTEKLSQSITFLATGVLAQGMLSGKYRADTIFGENDRRAKSNYINFSSDFINRAKNLLDLLVSSEVPPVALAVAWVMRQSPRIIAIVGVKSRRQLQQILLARQVLERSDIWKALEEEAAEFAENA